MSPCGSTVVVLLCLLLASAQDGRTLSESEWPCQHVTPQRNISLDQVIGEWYMDEVCAPYPVGIPFLADCLSVRFSLVGDSVLNCTIGEKSREYNINDPAKPWHWNVQDANNTALVLHLAGDASKLVIAGCVYSTATTESLVDYTVLSRRLPLSAAEAEAVNQAITAAGVIKTADYTCWKSSATCGAVQ